MKEIQLTKGMFAFIDDEDFELVSQYKWHYCNGYANTRIYENGKSSKYIGMHRLIMQAKPGEQIDHINGIKRDNHRSNLRKCTPKDNPKNCKTPVTNTTGFKGVCYRKRAKLFSAQISVQNKSIHIGYFRTAESAAIAYDLAAIKHYGQFARLNFP